MWKLSTSTRLGRVVDEHEGIAYGTDSLFGVIPKNHQPGKRNRPGTPERAISINDGIKPRVIGGYIYHGERPTPIGAECSSMRQTKERKLSTVLI